MDNYYVKNKEAVKLRAKLWAKNNKERRKEILKKSALKTRDYKNTQAKKAREENPQKYRDYFNSWYKNNKDKRKIIDERYKQKNKIEIVKKRAENYLKIKDKEALRAKIYRVKNREKILAKDKIFRLNNRDKIRESNRIWQLNKRRNDPAYKMKCNVRRRLHSFLVTKDCKNKRTINYVGCTWDELKKHLESQFREGMAWENYGYRGWHIDHKIPCSYFNPLKEEDLHKMMHYTNLQPLWAAENIAKSNKLIY